MASSAPLLANDTLPAAKAGPGSATVLGVLTEAGDKRVSLAPQSAAQLVKDGYVVVVQNGAGAAADFDDAAYTSAGCEIAARANVISKSSVLFSITAPEADYGAMKGKAVVSWVGRLTDEGKALVEKAASAGVLLVDVTAVPRITIAQQMDTLSSQAKCAGHRAVIEAAHLYGRFHGAEMTAAGKYAPAATFVLGCGVAGLEAIGKSKALGSAVRAWDVRDVSDQVESMGAKWVKVDFNEDGAGQGGYAKESSIAFQDAQKATFLKTLKEVDIAICTAAIPGRPSPVLITKEAVAAMRPGSVIIDLAALGGGNCELTKKGEVYTTDNKVTIIGYTDLPSRMPGQASAMYGQNMVNLLRYVHGKEKGKSLMENVDSQLNAGDSGDIIVRSIVCCRNGAAIAMPPPPQPTPPKKKAEGPAKAAYQPPSPKKVQMTNAIVMTLFISIFLVLGEGVSNALLTTFMLAAATGYQAVWGVAHALHTPLMSVTNAISGMTAVGGMILLHQSSRMEAQVMAAVAIAVSAINIFGGFVVSQRMLNLFRRPGQKDYSWYMIIPGVILAGAGCHHAAVDTVATISSFLCVCALGGLASMDTADMGCKFGIIGTMGAVTTTFVKMSTIKHDDENAELDMKLKLILTAGLIAIFGCIGFVIGKNRSPMSLPQTVAAFHSLVGAAAALTSIGHFAENPVSGATTENFAAVFGDIIGCITLTGSIVAWGKLNGTFKSKPMQLPCKNWVNLIMLLACIVLSSLFISGNGGNEGLILLGALGVVSCILGIHLVACVGGGDMPCCVTVLNSYSGWALVAEGFLLNSSVLTVVGSLIGCSGAILTKIMCDAMNRDIFNVIFGGMNTVAPAAQGDDGPKVHVETTCDCVVEYLVAAKEVLIVPGYGLALSRAQMAVGELATALRDNGIHCKFGIHPVAGRMPGQMNVLLAEAGVPHEWVLEMTEVNPEMSREDVVLVMGANDVVNSAAQEVEGCSIWGMPVLEVWKAKKVIFCKRSMGGGYADLENPVFFKENTEMLLGDAKKAAEGLSTGLRQRLA